MARLGDSSTKGVVGSDNEPIDNRRMFKDCLRIFSVSINLLSQETIQNFMQQGLNHPLRIIIQRFIDSKSTDVEDAIEIIQFLTTYAQGKPGADHLVRENIFQYLPMNQCIVNAKTQDLYQ